MPAYIILHDRQASGSAYCRVSPYRSGKVFIITTLRSAESCLSSSLRLNVQCQGQRIAEMGLAAPSKYSFIADVYHQFASGLGSYVPPATGNQNLSGHCTVLQTL